jgi:hypothetical protein
MVIIKTSQLNGSEYCLGHNVDLGIEAGLTEEEIAAVQGGDYATSPLLNEAQRTAVRWAEAVTNFEARDDDALFERLREHFSEQQIVELTVLVGMWNWSNRLTEALHVVLEPPGERINFFHRRSDVVPAEARSDIVPAEARSDIVPAEARSDVVPAEARSDIVPAEARSDIVPAEARA